MLASEGVCVYGIVPRWVGKNSYLVQKGKAEHKVHLVPAPPVNRPELRSMCGCKRSRRLSFLLTLELCYIYLGSIFCPILGKVRKQVKFIFSFTKYLGA